MPQILLAIKVYPDNKNCSKFAMQTPMASLRHFSALTKNSLRSDSFASTEKCSDGLVYISFHKKIYFNYLKILVLPLLKKFLINSLFKRTLVSILRTVKINLFPYKKIQESHLSFAKNFLTTNKIQFLYCFTLFLVQIEYVWKLKIYIIFNILLILRIKQIPMKPIFFIFEKIY